MKAKPLRRATQLAPRRVGRGAFDVTDTARDRDALPDPAAPAEAPEAVFDRLTGPWAPHGHREGT